MTLKSMTGFARADGALGDAQWHWEVKSVNGRGLDVRLRLPPGTDSLEPRIRELVSTHLTRGSINIALTLTRQAAASTIRLNEAVLDEVLRAADRVRHKISCDAPRIEGLLALKGVLESSDPVEDEEAAETRARAMLADLDRALAALVAARAGEGQRLAAVLEQQLSEISRLVALIDAAPSRSAEAVKARLVDQVARLFEAGPSLDPARLHQEAMLLATRADIAEELARLTTHIAAARDLMHERGAVGRKFDFLAQEFNREANTICSKAIDATVTRAGLELKAVIEQMREQVQNIE